MNISIIADNLERCRFFVRLAQTLQGQLGANITFYVYRFSCSRYLRSRGYEATLISRSKFLDNSENDELHLALELLRNDLKEIQALRISRIVMNFLATETPKRKPDIFFIWNGQQLVESCVAQFCKTNNIKTLFWEIGNFPRKMVADPKGVNIRGTSKNYISIARNTNQIDKPQFESWAAKLISEKRSKGAPQAKSAKQVPVERLLDLLAPFLGFGIRTISLSAAAHRLANKVRNQKYLDKYSQDSDLICRDNAPYVFFPLQVSTDTQILANSDISMDAAVQKAIAETENKVNITLKFHPAEINLDFIDKIVKIVRKSEHAFLSFEDTYNLISNSEKVYVINSTVGYEALLMGKDVHFFTDTHYPHDKQDYPGLYCYYNNYLVGIDYYSDDPIMPNQIQQSLERVSHENNVRP
jgi:capsular polysaccharide export protein